jgi:hypothetical protein
MVHTLLPVLLSAVLGGPAPPGGGAIRPDQIDFDSVFLPRDTVDTATVFGCWARLRNYSDLYIGGWAYLSFVDSAQNRTYYAESGRFYVPPYACDTAAFRSVRFRELGAFTALLWLPGGDTIKRWFWVAPATGIDEGRPTSTNDSRRASTVMLRVPKGAAVFDATGRYVPQPKAGVYFLREATSVGYPASVVRKVIISK